MGSTSTALGPAGPSSPDKVVGSEPALRTVTGLAGPLATATDGTATDETAMDGTGTEMGDATLAVAPVIRPSPGTELPPPGGPPFVTRLVRSNSSRFSASNQNADPSDPANAVAKRPSTFIRIGPNQNPGSFQRCPAHSARVAKREFSQPSGSVPVSMGIGKRLGALSTARRIAGTCPSDSACVTIE